MSCFYRAALVALLFAVPASAQTKKALDLVPHDAMGVIVVKDLRQLSNKVEELARKLKVAERVSLLELIHKDIGIRRGLDEGGSALFVVLKGRKEKSSPEVVTALPVADHQEVARQLKVKQADAAISEGEMGIPSSLLVGIGGKESGEKRQTMRVLVARKGDIVLLASPENRELLQQVLNARKSVTASLRPAREWMENQDVAGVSTDHGVKAGLAMILAGVGSST